MIHDKTILVTGGAGFLGSNYVLRQVRQEEYCIINLDALTRSGNLESLSCLDGNLGHHFVLGSIAERSLSEYLMLRYQPWAVVNFAAETQVDPLAEPPDSFVQTNTNAVFELLESTRKYWKTLDRDARDEFRFLQVSTGQVYGAYDGQERDENSAYRPDSPYAASRAAANHFVDAYHHTYGLPTLIAHCTANFGPHQFPHKFLPELILKVISGTEILVDLSESKVSDWIYVEDTCRAIDSLLQRGIPGQSYNVSSGERKSCIEVARAVCALMDELFPKSPYKPHAELLQPGSDEFAWCGLVRLDSRKIREETEWKPQESFESGLRKTIQWYMKNNEWCQRIQDGSYQGEGAGLRLVRTR